MDDLLKDFRKSLCDASFARAGWDYELPPNQRQDENAMEKRGIARAREIWAANPDAHDDLRAVFAELKPLATMREIERQ